MADLFEIRLTVELEDVDAKVFRRALTFQPGAVPPPSDVEANLDIAQDTLRTTILAAFAAGIPDPIDRGMR